VIWAALQKPPWESERETVPNSTVPPTKIEELPEPEDDYDYDPEE